MDTSTFWPAVLDNTAEGVTAVQQNVTTKTAAPKSLTLVNYIGYSLGFSTGNIGIVANAVVLAVLIRARRQFGSSVNTLIINQTLLDFLACCFVTVTLFLYATDRFVYDGSKPPFAEYLICILLDAGALPGLCMTGGKIGLMVITLERYFKIVHAVAHRKHFRDWMTNLAVAVPWITGVGFTLFPSIGTTKIIHGLCYRLTVWPNKAMALAYAVFRFILLYAMPVSVFAYCYARIFHTIRRQSKVVSGQSGRGQDVATVTTSRDANTGQPQQQATGTANTTAAKLSHIELNILKTMIAVIICFLVCWSTFSVINFLFIIKVVDDRAINLSLYALIGFINPSLNPFIYAARYEVFRRTLKQIFNRGDAQTQSTQSQSQSHGQITRVTAAR